MSASAPLHRLTAAAFAAHAADQLVFAALPLLAVLLGHGPGVVGVLVGVQSSAWLLVSLPAGRWADRLATRALVLRALMLSLAGLAVGAASAGVEAVAMTALSGFAVAGAAAAVAIATVAAVPRLAPPPLARANARVELARAAASLGAPLCAGLLVGLDARLPFAAAAAVILLVTPAASRLPDDDARPVGHAAPSTGLRDAAASIWSEARLRAVACCAVAWNFGFFALAGVFVPLAAARGLSSATIGAVLSGYGAGLILGALAAPRVLARAAPGAVLVFGPASSILGAALIAAAPQAVALAAGQFLLGLGPMLWMVARTGLLQSVTRPDQRGQVAAVMQVSVFGVRPLGALAGAALSAAGGIEATLALALAAFTASLVVILASPAGALRRAPAQ
ncbi:MFS transporter [Elioraea sp.]|uniref:MFS transporter n=1 Tax=Elioraea sp. TaxID=2185103 RepID=UPI003F71A5EB